MATEKLDISSFISNDKGETSILKIAMALSTVDDSYDTKLVDYFSAKGYRCVITRAGGRGDNFKYKLFRNILAAAENADVIYRNPENEYTIYRAVEKIVWQIHDELENISGGGAKIGIVSKGAHLAIVVYGSMGIPGMNVDREILAMDVQYFSLKN